MITSYLHRSKKIVFSFFFNLFLFFCCSPLLYSQYGKNAEHDNISGKLRTYSIKNAPEKIYLQTDKDLYSTGETIWFKAYLIDGISHKKSEKSSVVYVDLLNDKDSIVASRKLFFEGIGASGDIEIDGFFNKGEYQLRAYTQFMLNDPNPILFEKPIFIWNREISDTLSKKKTGILNVSNNELIPSAQKLSAQFFPEGGNIIAGLQNILGFEIKDGNGNGVSTEGTIIEANGTPVSYFKSHDFGLGILNFVPEKGKKYYAVIEHSGIKEKFSLPVPLEEGFMLNVKNNVDHLVIMASSTVRKGLEGAFLVGHLRGDVFFERHINKSNSNNGYIYKLKTDKLSDGVAQFTLFSKNGEPLCERLVFIDDPNNDAFVNIITSEGELGYRNSYDVSLEISNDDKELLKGELSMSVFKVNNGLKPEHGPSNIKAWLLLNSDLGGSIPNANYFFEDNSGYRKRLLDALMLTHGWRRFVWKEFLSDSVSRVPRFEPEKGIMINGKTTLYNNQYKPFPTEVKMSFLGENFYQENKPTDTEGKFTFGPFFFQDTISGVAEVVAKNNFIKDKAKIHVETLPKSIIPVSKRKLSKDDFKNLKIESFSEIIERKEKKNDFKIGSEVRRLKEVTITGERKTRKQMIGEQLDRMTALYSEPSDRIMIDSFPGLVQQSAFDVLRLVPGVQVRGAYPNQTVQIQGASSVNSNQGPLFLFDGAPTTLDFVQFMRANEIMFIDVLKGPDATIFGARGTNGVVAIYGKRAIQEPWDSKQFPGVTNFKVPGFYKAKEFYSPNYSMPKPEHKNPDYRTTLHWEPEIVLNGKDKASLKLFTGDISGEYIIKVEGMTTDGRPVFNLSKIVVDDSYSKF